MPQPPATTPGGPHDSDSVPPSRSARRTHQAQTAQDVRRAYRVTGLSALLPGLGLLFTRRRTLGTIMSLAAVLVVLLTLYSLMSGGVISGAAQFLTARGLLTLLALFVVGGILWVFGIMLTAQETRRDGWNMRTVWWHRGFAALLCLMVATPATIGANYVLITQDAFSKMAQDRFTGRGGSAKTPGAGEDPWKNVPRVNMLLIGSDAGKDREGVRTDSVMLASVDTRSGDTTLASIPRNLKKVPFPKENPLHKKYPRGFDCPTGECIMDAVWHEAAVNERKLFPKSETNPGLNTTREVVEEITGQPIDYTMVVDLRGFEQLVDAMGGVEVNVKQRLPIGGVSGGYGDNAPGVDGWIEPGSQKLGGWEALWYARSRATTSDHDRTRRQRCMVNALVSQVNPPTMLQKFPGIMRAAGDNITFDIPQEYLPAFATLAETMKKGNMRSVNLSPPIIVGGNPDYPKIQKLVQEAIDKPHDDKAPKSKGTNKPKPTSTTTEAPEPSSTSSSTTTTAIDDTRSTC